MLHPAASLNSLIYGPMHLVFASVHFVVLVAHPTVSFFLFSFLSLSPLLSLLFSLLFSPPLLSLTESYSVVKWPQVDYVVLGIPASSTSPKD